MNTVTLQNLQSQLLAADARGDTAERARLVAEMQRRVDSTIDRRDPATIAADNFKAAAIDELKGAKAHVDYVSRTPMHPNTRRQIEAVAAGRLNRAETQVRGLGIDPSAVQA